MKSFLLKLYLYWSLFIFTVVMLVLLPFMVLPYAIGLKYGSHISYYFMRLWGLHFVFPNGGIRFRVHGREKIKGLKACIYCANHNSFMDTPAAVAAVPRAMKPLGKVEMLKVPIFGFIYRYVVVLVDRKSPESRRRSMVQMQQQIQNGVSILIFPEGSMNVTTEPMQPFFDGAFRIAVDAQCPIVPMVIVGSAARLRAKGSFNLSPGPIDIYLLDPISTAGMKAGQVAALKTQVYDLMLAEYLRRGGKAPKAPALVTA